ncbi:MAG: hypothetical protein R2774_11900 [Saprospiraceae bacterium]
MLHPIHLRRLRQSDQGLMHGWSGAAITILQGGNPGRGFVSGLSSSLTASTVQNLGGGKIATIIGGSLSGGVGAAVVGGDFYQGAVFGLISSSLNHVAHEVSDAISLSQAKKIMKEYYALVAGESSDNYDEARAIGEIILKRAELKGVKLKPGWVRKLGKFDAIDGAIYTEIMKMSYDEIVSLQSNDSYYIRIKGADDAFWNPGADYSNGAYFFNATSQKNKLDIGFNFRTYNRGIFTKTAELGKSTFFKYTDSKKKWP